MKIGVIYSRLRVEEKWLFQALEQRNISHERIQDDGLRFDISEAPQWQDYSAVIVRSLSTSRGLYASQVLNSWGVRTINPYRVGAICADKAATTLALAQAGVPQPRVKLAFTPEAAIAAGEELGYPYVVKPVLGSWGRLVNRVNDRDAAEAIFEHREVLGSFNHQIYYLQEYIQKPMRDIRAFVIGDQTPVAIYRASEHWITNTARGGKATECPVTPELHDICQKAAQAVGGGVLAIDVLEDPQRGYVINEINHTMEFHSTVPLTGVDIPGLIVEYACKG
ncbi:MAG TPA: lysine biosynthesis protein LysX [Anaerolineales bacterium]|nr:lysine biosynthesis protein LysX [Anaerolineales bacterium]